VHVVFALDDSVAAVQDSRLIVAGTCSNTVAVAVVPFRVAVRVAAWLNDTAPVEMANVAVVEFAITGTDAVALNTGEALFVNATTAPPAGAAWDSVTVQLALPLEDSVATVQVSALIVADACNEIVVVAVVRFKVPASVAV